MKLLEKLVDLHLNFHKPEAYDKLERIIREYNTEDGEHLEQMKLIHRLRDEPGGAVFIYEDNDDPASPIGAMIEVCGAFTNYVNMQYADKNLTECLKKAVEDRDCFEKVPPKGALTFSDILRIEQKLPGLKYHMILNKRGPDRHTDWYIQFDADSEGALIQRDKILHWREDTVLTLKLADLLDHVPLWEVYLDA